MDLLRCAHLDRRLVRAENDAGEVAARPGKAARAVRAGANLAAGGRTWEGFLAERVSG